MINTVKYSSKLALTCISILLLSSWVSGAMPQNQTIIIQQVKVGVILDGHTLAGVEQVGLRCIELALSDFYVSNPHYKTRVILKVRYSQRNVVHAAAAALDLIRNEKVEAIIGAVTSMETSFVIDLGNQAHVPIVSFSATSPSLASIRSPYFFQLAQNDLTQVEAISCIVKTFGWRIVVLIYIDTTYGEELVPYLADALEEIGARVSYRSVISPSASDDQIEKELYKLMTMQSRVFVVHMTSPALCSRLLDKAKAIGMTSEQGYVWIITSGITNRLTLIDDISFVKISMEGVLGVQTYVPVTKGHEVFMRQWLLQFLNDTPPTNNKRISGNLDVFALWAYDAAHALAIASEKVTWTTTSPSSSFRKTDTATNDLTDLDSSAVSQHGQELQRALTTTRFNGIAGEFKLVDNRLQSSNFRIVHINGGVARTIGFWTHKNGLHKSSVMSNDSLIWPAAGDTHAVPKGWEIPTNAGNKLRIVVPQKVVFTEFVKITKDGSTNRTYVTGFSIDVFEAAVKMLPYALTKEFIPFAGNNDDLCYQLSIGNFDAIVGDTTITANRSLYVDFTMPYTETAIDMVVLVRDSNRKNALAFLKPWKWDLWFAIACFFLLIGFVVWLLEHRINKYFRGPPSHQVGTTIWFSFSTMVFSQTAKVVSNWARVVMIIWIFVLLVLTINYTASLTSVYTVEKLEPTVTDIKDVFTKGEKVGHVSNYVGEMLKTIIGFDDSNLVLLRTVEDIYDALSKGQVAAVVDETPNLRIFLSKYCNSFTMVGRPLFRTAGYAFAFPKGSPFVRDVSQAVLNVTGGDEIMKIENKWFKKDSSCQDLTTPNMNTKGLGVDSFWLLFVIVACASLLALIIFAVSFVYRHKVIIWTSEETSIWSKIRNMLNIFNEKDLSSHTFNIKEREDEFTSFPNYSLERSTHPNLYQQGDSDALSSGSREPHASSSYHSSP